MTDIPFLYTSPRRACLSTPAVEFRACKSGETLPSGLGVLAGIGAGSRGRVELWSWSLFRVGGLGEVFDGYSRLPFRDQK